MPEQNLEQRTKVSLRVNERFALESSGLFESIRVNIIYGGMISDNYFAMIKESEIGTGHKNGLSTSRAEYYQLYFPAKRGRISFKGGTKRIIHNFKVEEVTPERLVLTYLGGVAGGVSC